MKAWSPGNLICEDADEHYEPLDKKDRILAAKITLTIRLAMHRAAELQKHIQAGPPQLPNCRCVTRPIISPE